MDFDGASRQVGDIFDLTEGWNDENETTWCKEEVAEEVVNERLRSSGVTDADTGVWEREMVPTVDAGLMLG